MGRKNFISGLFILAFFGLFWYYSLTLEAGASYWPRMIAAAGTALSIPHILLSALAMRREEGGFSPISGVQARRVLFAAVTAALWVYCIPRIGWLVSSAAASCLITIVFEPAKTPRRLFRGAAAAVLFSLIIYALFSALGVHFPDGIFI